MKKIKAYKEFESNQTIKDPNIDRFIKIALF